MIDSRVSVDDSETMLSTHLGYYTSNIQHCLPSHIQHSLNTTCIILLTWFPGKYMVLVC